MIIIKSSKIKVNIFSLVSCIVFFALIVILPLVTVVLPKEEYSEIENKYFQRFPKFSAKALFKGDYTDDLETYIADHFAGRVAWLKGKANFEFALGKREQKDIYILPDRLIEKVGTPDYTEVDKSIAAINKFAEDNPSIPVYMMLVPTSAEFYKKEISPYNPNLDQKSFIDYVYGGLDSSIMPIDVYSELSANTSEYIFYRTDHHWTSYGAYLAYKAAGAKMGYTALQYSDYSIEHASSEFKGTFYSKVLYDGIKDDTIDYYFPVDGYDVTSVEVTREYGKEPQVYDSMYMREYLDVKDKYSSFLGENSPIVKITSENPDGKRLLIIKDSYAHCYAPFLTQNYSEITLLDLRYIKISYKKVVDMSEYDRVLFLYNASSFSTDTNIKQLSYS
ncbi:MAG: DHHW family protein [Oscillospiraceae bacterium]